MIENEWNARISIYLSIINQLDLNNYYRPSDSEVIQGLGRNNSTNILLILLYIGIFVGKWIL